MVSRSIPQTCAQRTPDRGLTRTREHRHQPCLLPWVSAFARVHPNGHGAVTSLPGRPAASESREPPYLQNRPNVGNSRSPGDATAGASAGIGPCRILLWSGLVVSVGQRYGRPMGRCGREDHGSPALSLHGSATARASRRPGQGQGLTPQALTAPRRRRRAREGPRPGIKLGRSSG